MAVGRLIMHLSDNIGVHVIGYPQTVLAVKHPVLYGALVESDPSKLVLAFGDSVTDFRTIFVFLVGPYYFVVDRVVVCKRGLVMVCR